MNDIDSLSILSPSFKGRAHVVRGRIALTLNDSVTKYFDIGDSIIDSASVGVLLATNSASNIKR